MSKILEDILKQGQLIQDKKAMKLLEIQFLESELCNLYNKVKDMELSLKKLKGEKEVFEEQLTQLVLKADQEEASLERKSVVYLLLHPGNLTTL